MSTVETPKRQLDRQADALVLDVRGATEFAGEGGQISGARDMPINELPQRLEELRDHTQRAIRLICRTDKRSARAARLLAEAGFADARLIQGSMAARLAKGQPAMR